MILRKNLLPFILLIVLAGTGIYFYVKKNNTTLNSKEFEFVIKDTAAIQKITIINSQDTIHLSRKNNTWSVEKQFQASQSMIKLCLRVMKDAEIQSVLSADMAEKARPLLQGSPLVSIKLKNDEEKQFYILANKISRQVWILLKNSSKPFVIALPSYEGNFAAIFYTKSHDWRENSIALSPQDLASIGVSHVNAPDKSFTIDFSKGTPILFTGNKKVLAYSQESIEQYFYMIQNIPVVSYIYDQHQIDSLKKQAFSGKLQLNGKDGSKTIINWYPKGMPADLNEAYIIVNNTDMAVVKYVSLDPLVPEIDFFKK